MARIKDLKIAGGKRPYPGPNTPLLPGPIDPKTGKPKYWYEDMRGYKGKYAKKYKSKKSKSS